MTSKRDALAGVTLRPKGKNSAGVPVLEQFAKGQQLLTD
jgi:hypothetical protein